MLPILSLIFWPLLLLPAGSDKPTLSLTWSEVKVAQSCLTLFDPMDYTVHEILQARILEWIAVPFSRGSSHPRDRTQVSRIAGGFFTSWATREALRKPQKGKLANSVSFFSRFFPPSFQLDFHLGFKTIREAWCIGQLTHSERGRRNNQLFRLIREVHP